MDKAIERHVRKSVDMSSDCWKAEDRVFFSHNIIYSCHYCQFSKQASMTNRPTVSFLLSLSSLAVAHSVPYFSYFNYTSGTCESPITECARGGVNC